MPNYDPGEYNADEVIEHLSKVKSGRERDRILTAEAGGKDRVSVFNANPAFDRDARRDASGRILNDWEPTPPRPAAADEAEVVEPAANAPAPPPAVQDAFDNDPGDDD